MTTSKDYSRGYVAGRKRTEADIAKLEAARSAMATEQSRFEREVLCAVLSGLISGPQPWTMGGKSVKTQDEYIALAKSFATQAALEMFK